MSAKIGRLPRRVERGLSASVLEFVRLARGFQERARTRCRSPPRWPRKSSRPHAPRLRRGPGPGFGAQGNTIRCRASQFDAETAQPDCEGTADLTPTSPCHLRCGSVCASPPKSGSSARRTFWGAACLPPSGKVSLSVAGRGERRSEQGVWTKNEFMKRNLQHSTTKKNARSGFRERDTLHHRQCENVTGVNYSEVWSGGAGEQSRHPCFLSI